MTRLFRSQPLLVSLVAALLPLTAVSAEVTGLPIIFDVVADFSSSNPNGSWTYGYSQTRGTEFQRMTQFHPDGIVGLDSWGATDNGPWMTKNKTAATFDYSTVSQAPNLLRLDPSLDGRNAVVRWTAPAAGQYRVSGLFQGIDSTSTDVAVLTTGTPPILDPINGRGDQSVFDFMIDLAAGQTVDFSVGQGSGGSLYDSTGLKATIQRIGAPPEPVVGVPIVFDAVADFSSSNPGGPWTYGYTQTRGAEFQRMTQFHLDAIAGLDSWGATDNGPFAGKNKTSAALPYYTILHPPDLLNLDPSLDGRNAVVRWTTPAAGQFRVKGLFQGLDSTSTDAAVLTNGTAAAVTSVNGRGNQVPFDFVVGLSTGQTVDFSVGQGSGGSLYDSTGLKATIERLGAPPNGCAPFPSGLISWWRGESNTLDGITANHAIPVGRLGFAPGRVGAAFSLNGVELPLEVPDSSLVRPERVSVEAWVRLNALDNLGLVGFKPGLQYIVFKKNTRRVNFEGFALLKHRVAGVDQFAFEVTSTAGVPAIAASKTVVKAKEWYHLVGTYDGSTAKLFVNGVQESSQPARFPLDYGNRPLFIGRSGESYHDGWFVGEIDEVSLYNRALSGAEVGTLFNAADNGKCAPGSPGGREVAGQALDSAGAPVVGVEVAAFRNMREFVSLGFNGALARALTDASGGYRIAGLPNDKAVTLIARYDANQDGQDLDNRVFAPAHQLPFVSSVSNQVPPFVLQPSADLEPPSLTVSNPSGATANELLVLFQATGATADAAGILGVWGALARNEALGTKFFNWDNGQFESATSDAPQYYSAAVLRSTATGHDWELPMPRLAEGSYQLRLMSVDNARRLRRVNADFRVVPVTHTFTTGGEPPLPPVLPGANLSLRSTDGDVKVSLPGDISFSRLDIGAAAGSSLTVLVPPGVKVITDGIDALKGATLVLPGAVAGAVKNVGGTVGHAVAPIAKVGGELAGAFDAVFKGFFGKSALSPAASGSQRALQSPGFARSAAVQPVTGAMTVEGDYEQGADGKLVIALAGTNYSESGSKEHDRLAVSGTATLSGTLAFTFIDANDSSNNPNPFLPPAGSQFDVIVASRIEVANLTVLGPLAGGRSFEWGIADLADGSQALRLISTASVAARLSIRLNGNSIEISYPAEATGFAIQATTDLGSGGWTTLTTATNRVTVSPGNTPRFFRLSKP